MHLEEELLREKRRDESMAFGDCGGILGEQVRRFDFEIVAFP